MTGFSSLANRLPDVYEKYLAFMFPTMNIRAEFEVVKDAGPDYVAANLVKR